MIAERTDSSASIHDDVCQRNSHFLSFFRIISCSHIYLFLFSISNFLFFTCYVVRVIFYIYHTFRDLIAASAFEQLDKSRTYGRNPILRVIVSALDKITFSSTSESLDNFDLQMQKPSSNLKNTNGIICDHYKRTNIKILEVK